MKIITKLNIKHNGNFYKPGEEIKDLNDEQLKSLKEAEAVEIKGVKEKTIESNFKPTKKKERTENENATEVANMKLNSKMSKATLRGVGLARGLEIPKELTRNDIFKIVKKDFDKRGKLEFK